jgi:hypothetical protein
VEQCKALIHFDSAFGRLECENKCLANRPSGPLVFQWEINVERESGRTCKRIILTSNGSYELLWKRDNETKLFLPGDKGVNKSICAVYADKTKIYVNSTSGALHASKDVWDAPAFDGAVVKCYILGEGCRNDEEPKQFTSSVLAASPRAQLEFLKSSPELEDGISHPVSSPLWQYGSNSSHLCLSLTLFNHPLLTFKRHGTALNTTDLHMNGEACTDCNNPVCIQSILKKLGRKPRQGEAYKALWRSTCAQDAVLVVFFNNVTFNDSGRWSLELPDHRRVIYQVSVVYNSTATFLHKPSSTVEVPTGSSINITCAIAAPINQPDENTYWTDPSGNMVPSITTLTNISSAFACQLFSNASRNVFAVRESHTEYSEGGALRHHTLVLHVCDATSEYKRPYHCGVRSRLSARAHLVYLIEQESENVSSAMILSAVLAVVLFLIVILLGVVAVLCCCLISDDVMRRKKKSLSILRQQSMVSSSIDGEDKV